MYRISSDQRSNNLVQQTILQGHTKWYLSVYFSGILIH